MRNAKIKILHITEPTIDGVKTHVVDLLSNLNPNVYKIAFLYSANRSDPKFNDDLACLKARGIQTFKCSMSGEIKPIDDVLALFHVFKFIQKGKFDLVHCHSSKAGFLGRVAAQILRVPVVIYTPHAFSFLSNEGIAQRLFYVYLERLAAKFCDRIICVSQSEKNAAISFKIAPQNKFAVIPNAIYFKKINCAKTLTLRKLYPEIIKKDDIIITTVGRLSYQKAPDLFVKAASRVAQEFNSAKFLYVGQGELKESIAKLARKLGLESKIIFTGYRDDVFAILKSSHIFVLCSRYEGLPYSVLEAMASKLPVVATNVTGTSELVMHGKTGILVPPENDHAMACAIIDLVRNPEKRKRLALAAYKHVLENHCLQTMIHSTENLYEELFRTKGSRKKRPQKGLSRSQTNLY